MWPEKDTDTDTAQKNTTKYTQKYRTLCAIESCFSCPVAAASAQKIKWYKLQDTFVATSSLGVAWLGCVFWALRHPPKAIGILGKVLQQLLATSVTTANNVSSSTYRYRYIYTARNYSAKTTHFPRGYLSFLPTLSLPTSPLSFSLLSIVRGRHFWRIIAIDALCFCKCILRMRAATVAYAKHSWAWTRRGRGLGSARVDPCTGCSKCLGTSHSFMQHATDASRR